MSIRTIHVRSEIDPNRTVRRNHVLERLALAGVPGQPDRLESGNPFAQPLGRPHASGPPGLPLPFRNGFVDGHWHNR